MNLTPDWVQYLVSCGWDAIHWSKIGSVNASDAEIMRWARENRFVVFTHDLDFAALLAHTRGSGPSVLQLRTQIPIPSRVGNISIAALVAHREDLERGSLVTVDAAGYRVRILPIL